MKSHLYGPVVSRRLGLSLGVDLVPFKICSFDCVYCQLGRTTGKSVRRESFYSADVILDQIRSTLESGTSPDIISFSGSGEPTLNSDLGRLIRGVKQITQVPVAVITNSSLLWDKQVQEELLAADLLLPSLDAGTEAVFQQMNRPHDSLNLEKIVDGLVDFRARYQGKIRLEVLLLEGINDGSEELERFQEQIARIDPDGIDLNTAVRPPAESFAKPLTPRRMEEIRNLFGERATVVSQPPSVRRKRCPREVREVIIEMLGRRPCTMDELATALGRHRHEVAKFVGVLLEERLISQKAHGGRRYFIVGEE